MKNAKWLILLLFLATCVSALADTGLLSVKCDGSDKQFVIGRRSVSVEHGMSVFTHEGGYRIYRIPIGKCSPEFIYYTIGGGPYSLEFSSDGKLWHSMNTIWNKPMSHGRSACVFIEKWQDAAKKSGTVYLKFTCLPSQSGLMLASFDFVVTGNPLPENFKKLPDNFDFNSLVYKPTPTYGIPGLLMIVLGLVAAIIFSIYWRTSHKLFELGALLFVVAGAVQAGIAIIFNKPMEHFLHHVLPKHPADLIFWIYIGLLAGITEVGIFLAMKDRFQRRTWSWKDAASIGIGLGVIDSILVGAMMLISALMGNIDNTGSFISVLEKFLTIFVHVTATVAAIYGITNRKWGWFIFAFIYKSSFYAVVAYFLLSAYHTLILKPLLVDLGCFGPFAFIAIPILWILWNCWNMKNTQPESTNV